MGVEQPLEPAEPDDPEFLDDLHPMRAILGTRPAPDEQLYYRPQITREKRLVHDRQLPAAGRGLKLDLTSDIAEHRRMT
jgi:hypothetical protein